LLNSSGFSAELQLMRISHETQAVLAAAERGATVVTANRRAARHLRSVYDRWKFERGEKAWPSPDFSAWPALISRFWQELAVTAQCDIPFALAPAQERQLWKQIIGADADPSVGPMAQDAWRLSREYRLELVRHEMKTPEAAAFFRWSQKFSARCSELKAISAAEQSSALVHEIESGALSSPAALIMTGFDRFSPQQTTLLQALQARGAKVSHAGTAVAAAPSVIACQNSDDEIATVARWVAARLELDRSATVGIVVPDLGSRRASIERSLRMYLQPECMLPGVYRPPAFHISLGRPLPEQPPVAAALMMLRWCDAPLTLDEAAFLLRSPFFAGVAQERSARALLQRELCRGGAARVAADQVRVAAAFSGSAHNAPQLARLLTHVVKFSDASQKPSAWSAVFAGLLAACGWPGERSLNSSEFQAVRRWSELLREFAALEAILGDLSRAAAIEFLSQTAAEVTFEPEDTGAPVQVVGILEAAGSEFDALWVMGLDAQSWPMAAHPNPFLPLELQRTAEMPNCSPQANAEFCARVLRRLRSSAAEVVFSYASQDGERELQPSPALDDCGSATVDELAPPVRSWYDVLPFAAEPFEPAPAPSFSGALALGGSALLKSQAACPFRAFAEFRLHTRETESPDDALSPLDRGKLLHRVMKRVWERLLTQQELSARTEAELRDLVRGAISAAFESSSRIFTTDLREQLGVVERARLELLVLQWLEHERVRQPFRVVSLEEKRECEIGGIRLNITRDRVDQLADGRRVLLDYKTGDVKKGAWRGERPDEPQLPLYAATEDDCELAAVAFAQVRTGSLRFCGVQNENGIVPGKDVEPLGGALRTQIGEWQTVLTDLAHEFLEGRADPRPKHGAKTCAHCRLPALCRIAELDHAEFLSEAADE
jgi:ATP-dependent helicase/nuclease subunit B